MYPKVKVRTETQDDQYQHNWRNTTTLLSLKDIQFLLLQDSCFPVKEYQDVSPLLVARIPESYVPNIILPTESSHVPNAILPNIFLPSESSSEGSDKKSNCSEDDRPKIRAGSVPRPRAVISSPDNDALIANKNRVKAVKPSPLKSHDLTRHTQCKVVTSQATDESPLNTRKQKDTPENKVDLRKKKESAYSKVDVSGKKGSAAYSLSSHRRSITTAKPSSLRK